jgi:hypothetical protein
VSFFVREIRESDSSLCQRLSCPCSIPWQQQEAVVLVVDVVVAGEKE